MMAQCRLLMTGLAGRRWHCGSRPITNWASVMGMTLPSHLPAVRTLRLIFMNDLFPRSLCNSGEALAAAALGMRVRKAAAGSALARRFFSLKPAARFPTGATPTDTQRVSQFLIL